MLSPVLLSPPVRRWIAAATLVGVAAAGAVRGRARPAPHSYQLTLEAAAEPGCVYYSTWDDGAVFADHDAFDGREVEYRRDFVWTDGCDWQAVERLIPDGAGYRYEYAEHWVSCPEGRQPSGTPSPRTGRVTVARVPFAVAPTELHSIAPDPDSVCQH